MIAEKILESQNGNQVADEPDFFEFYHVKIKGDGDNIKREVVVDYFLLIELLKKLGFRRLDIDRIKFIVRIIDNVVEEVDQTEVIDTFIDYLNQFQENFEDGVLRDNLIGKIYRSQNTYFSESMLHRMRDDTPITFNVDTKEEAFFYYRNGYVRVNKKEIKLLPYKNLKKKIWKNQILPRKFKKVDGKQIGESPFARFVSNISDNYIDKKTQKPKNPGRYLSLMTVIGYNLHAYFEGKLRATILTDSRISEDASGRTGKTLLCKAIMEMLNKDKFAKSAVEVNGKDFDLADRFKYQKLAIDTKFVHINDVKRRFDFQGLFNDITEGIQCQRKNETPFTVFSKMVLSTNMTINVNGDSAKDRSIEFEMADYYSAEFSPEKEFGHWFFRDWSENDWFCFDNFMLQCVQSYLKHGIIKPETINLDERKLLTETAPEFLEFMEAHNIEHGVEYDKKDLFSAFISFGSNFRDFKKLRSRTFLKWMKLYAKYHFDYEDEVVERSSNGKYLISFLKTEAGQAKEAQKKKDIFDPDFVPKNP